MNFTRIFKFLKSDAIKVHVGEEVRISCPSHGSVGIASKIKFDERFFSCHVTSTTPSKCAPGGDYGIKTYHLTAIKSGKTVVEVIEMFRGRVTKTTTTTYKIK